MSELFVASAAEAPMEPLQRATAVPGRGLDGDRYAAGAGTFSAAAGAGATSRSSTPRRWPTWALTAPRRGATS